MPTFNRFEDIEAWQRARELVKEIYKVTNDSMFSRDRGLCNQIRRASVSVMSNIAEGFERNGTGEFVQFLSMAKGSVGEIQAQLYVAFDQGYINDSHFSELNGLAGETGRLIGGLMVYLRGSKIKGTKFK